MVDATTFQERLSRCRSCEFWRGACLKGHALTGDQGCPLKHFPGTAGADYLPDVPVPQAELPKVSASGCCGRKADDAIKPLTWGAVAAQLSASLRNWAASEFALASREIYAERVNRCRACPSNQYQWFQCKQCKCVVYTKAYLASEKCPVGHW